VCCVDQCTYCESFHIIPMRVNCNGDRYIIFRQAQTPSQLDIEAI